MRATSHAPYQPYSIRLGGWYKLNRVFAVLSQPGGEWMTQICSYHWELPWTEASTVLCQPASPPVRGCHEFKLIYIPLPHAPYQPRSIRLGGWHKLSRVFAVFSQPGGKWRTQICSYHLELPWTEASTGPYQPYCSLVRGVRDFKLICVQLHTLHTNPIPYGWGVGIN